MMFIPRRRKKTRKLRGSRLYGYGKQRQHRRSGRGGGFGGAGVHKHWWTWYTAHWPDYFGMGRRGFKRPRVREINSINLGDIDRMIEELKQKGAVRIREDGKLEVDLSIAGYDKVLGKGRIDRPMVIKARTFSRIALERISQAGGEAVEV
jgi:large subunit ribosomal protein L15